MSEPKRYKVGKIGTTEMIDCVSYDDYARLKAEVERLTADLPKMVAWGRGLEHDKRLLEEENARLKAEVERLKESGKNLCKAASHVHPNCPTPRWDWLRDAEMRWEHTAKEGKKP